MVKLTDGPPYQKAEVYMVRNPLLSGVGTHAEMIAADNLLITELPLVFPGGSIPIDGTMTPITQIVAQLTQHRDGLLLGDQLRAQLHNVVAATDAEFTVLQAAIREVEAFAGANLGRNSDKFAALGFTPPKKAVKSPAVKAEAAVRGNATRTARGTKGKNQKKAIHGTVPPPAESPSKK
jgi:hypothetical protein